MHPANQPSFGFIAMELLPFGAGTAKLKQFHTDTFLLPAP
jgi:hypothetical protein